jgi:phosphatidylserine/phosphatidylglycerophosphate/cardiolipin synthase-like enzyme
LSLVSEPALPRAGRARRAQIFGAILLGLSHTPAVADVRIAGFELVHTTPVETGLATPDIRDPVTVWCEMIDHARRTIDFGQFYVASKAGEPLERVIDRLEAAGRRGVRIRFLMEQKGQGLSEPETIARLRRIPNLDFQLLNYSKLSEDGIIHAKYFIVDDAVAYVGSQNFDWRSLKHIDETGLRIDDPPTVAKVRAIFALDWSAQQVIAAGGTVASEVGISDDPQVAAAGASVAASPAARNPAGVADSERVLPSLIAEAKRQIGIEVMEYAPLDRRDLYYGVIDQAIRAAAQRGVQVELLVSDWNLTAEKLPYLKSLAVLPHVAVRIVTLPRNSGAFIPFARVVHTKTMTIDDEIAWIGTSNWEGKYMDASRNIEIVLRNQVMARRVAALHQQLWGSAYAKPLDLLADYPAPHPGRE